MSRPTPARSAAPARTSSPGCPTPGKATCEDVAQLLKIPLQKTVKSIAVMQDAAFHLLLLRGDHALNEIKTQKAIGAFRFASEKEIVAALHCKPGYIGPP